MGNAVSEHVGYDSVYKSKGKKKAGRAEVNTDPEDEAEQKDVVAEENPKPAVGIFRMGSGRSTLLRVASFGSRKRSKATQNRVTAASVFEPCKEEQGDSP